MKHEPIASAAPLDGVSSTEIADELAPPEERHDGWTRARQARFLRELAATHCVTQAARRCGMSRQSAYKLRARLKGEPFDIAWQCAFRRQYDALAEAALERALNGVEVPHYHRGELIGTSRRFDERLTVALLAMRGSLAMPPPARFDEQALIPPDDFVALVERVEHGDEQWSDVEYEYEDEAGGGADDAEAAE